MIDLLMIFFSQLIVVTAGYAAVTALTMRGRSLEVSWLFLLAVSFLTGLGVISLQIFLYSWIGIPLSIVTVSFPWGLVAFLLIGRQLKFGRLMTTFSAALPYRNLSVFAVFMEIIIVIQAAYSLLFAVTMPVVGWDAWAIWLFKAKAFFLSDGLPSINFFEPAFYQPDYPLLTSLAVTWNYICLGRADDQLGKIIFPLTLIALWVIFYVSLARKTNRDLGLFFAALLSMTPVLILHGGGYLRFDYVGFADLSFSVYLMGAGIFLYYVLSENDRTWDVLYFLFLGMAAWTKNEGLTLAIAGGVVYLLASKRWKRSFYGILTINLFVLPWAIFKLYFSVHNGGYLSGLRWPDAGEVLGRIPMVLGTAGKALFSLEMHGLVWPLFFLTTLICWRNLMRGPLAWSFWLLTVQFFVYMGVYLISPLDWVWLMSNSWDRLIVHLSPLAFWIAGMNTYEMVRRYLNMPQPAKEAVHGTG